MVDDNNHNTEISRRSFLELGSAAVTGVAGILAATDVASGQSAAPAVKTGRTNRISDPGPTNTSLDAANADVNVPPVTDAGDKNLAQRSFHSTLEAR